LPFTELILVVTLNDKVKAIMLFVVMHVTDFSTSWMPAWGCLSLMHLFGVNP